MGETITSKGKTTKKALDLALKRLNKDISEVDIEILNYEKKSILGFKTEPAIVKVTAKETMGELVNDFSIVEKILSVDMDKKQEMPTIIQQELPLEIDANLIDKELSGKAWVINGKVFCKDAINKYALIEPTEGISLYKNGKLIHSIVTINENDVINIETNNDEILPSWDIKISADNMEAYLVIKAGLKVSRVLKDQKPSSYIKLEAEEVRTPLTISQDEVLNELRRLHILHGIDYEAIRNACALGKDGTFLIAKGRTPIKG